MVVADNAITGTLKYINEPGYVNTWQTNWFMALQFVDQDEADKIEVGIQGQTELDSDMIAVIAVENLASPLKVIVTKGEQTETFEYDLSGLTLAEE